jgi:hypothetical protein
MKQHLLLSLFLLFLCMSGTTLPLSAQQRPVVGKTHTVVYNPPAESPLAKTSSLTLYYVFDFWHVRYGTRMALWQNVLRPDTNRLHSAPMQRSGQSWQAEITIPSTAALLSWIVSDGEHLDGNNEKTFVEYVFGDDGKPVRNARYFNVQFLRLARSEPGTLVREMERELADYPDNFIAYHQYFSLLIEQGKGSVRVQERIANRLEELESRHGGDDEFLNLAAQTWYYLLHDQSRGLDIRKRISPTRLWPQVLRMYDRETKQAEDMERQLQSRSRREQLLNTELPRFNLNTAEGDKSAFPRDNGRPLILLFWATTSERSMQKLSEVKSLLSANPGVDVVYVNVDVDETQAAEVATERGVLPHLLYNQGATLAILGIDSLPTLLAVDSRNVIRSIQVGFTAAQIEEVRALLPSLKR